MADEAVARLLPDEGRRYELCFRSFGDPSRAVAFPCDASGRVDLDALSDQARRDYLFARTVVGRLFDKPDVLAS